MRKHIIAVMTAALTIITANVQATTLAHWDFSDPALAGGTITNGAPLPDSDAYTVWRTAAYDQSGNGNDLTTFEYPADGFAWYTNDSVFGGAAISPMEGSSWAYTWSASNPPTGTDVEAFTFANITVEAYAKAVRDGNGWQVVVCRDGFDVSGVWVEPVPFLLGMNYDGYPVFEFADGSRRVGLISPSKMPVNDGQWHHLAATYDGFDVKLYVDYQEVASRAEALGSMAVGTTNGAIWHAGQWNVGRGMYDQNPTDFWKGDVDAVAISDTALTADTFVLQLPFRISGSPQGATYSPVVLEAEVVDLNSEFDTLDMYIDGSNLAWSAVSSGGGTTVVQSASAVTLSPGIHTGKVVVAGINPVSSLSYDWTFNVRPDPVELFNINMAGNTGGSAVLTNGTLIVAPSFGSNHWNNLIAPALNWNPAAPLSITNASGTDAISLDWSGSTFNCEKTVSTAGYLPLYQAYFGIGGINSTMELGDLKVGEMYDIYVYFTWPYNEMDATYTIVEGSPAASAVLSPDRNNVEDPSSAGDYSSLVAGRNYVLLQDISPSVSGNIKINVQSGDGGWNGIQIVRTTEAGVAIPFTATFSPADGSYEYTPIDVEARLVEEDGMFVSAEMFIDDVAVATNSSRAGVTNVLSYTASMLDQGVHTGKVVAVSNLGTNEYSWTFNSLLVPSGPVEDLWNINFAGRLNNHADVPDGTYVRAPAFGSNLWNNLVNPVDSTVWTLGSPLVVSNANGANPIGLEWIGFERDHNADGGFGTEDLFKGFFGFGGFEGTNMLSGLDPAAHYDIYVYFTWPYGGGAVTYTLTEGTGASNLVINPVHANVQGTSGYYENITEGDNYVVFRYLSPSASGTIGIHASAADGGWSGIQVVKVPPLAIDPNIIAMAVSGGNVMLTWDSETGRTYSIQHKTNLTDSVWMDAKTGISGSAPTTSDSVPASGADTEFFRIEAQ